MSTVRARLVGGDGLTRDLVRHACREADIEVSDVAPDVTLLADPGPDDWAAARAEGGAIVVLATRTQRAVDTVEAVTRGASAVVHGASAPHDLVAAVHAASTGQAHFDDGQAAELAAALRAQHERAGAPTLTAREVQILASIDRGESVKQTAVALGIAHKTVENLQGRLFAKLNVRNRAQAVLQAHALGLLPD